MCTDSTCSAPSPGRRALLGAALAAPVAPLVWSAAPTWAGVDRPRLLVFSRTTGFRHMSIETAVATITDLGAAHGFDVDATEDRRSSPTAAWTPTTRSRSSTPPATCSRAPSAPP